MKFSKIYLLLLLPVLFYTCKNDDDEGEPMMEDPLTNCCDIPAVNEAAGPGNIYIPNAFTPNNDGINDLFFVNASAEVTMIESMEVKDMNGTTLFMSFDFLPNNPIFGWNGTDTAGVVQQGVFDYTVVLETTDNQTYSFSGSVCSRKDFPLPCVENEEACQFAVQHDGEGGYDQFLPSFEECE